MKIFCFAFLLLSGCAGSGIPKEQYSLLQKPQDTFEFAQKAVGYDDPTAFYYCLTKRTQEQFKLSDLELGWSLAGSFFYLFLEARIKNVEIPAPEDMFQGNPNTAKITLESNQLEAAFLFYREQDQWKLVFPTPYPLPDISKIKKKQNMPWRKETLVFFQSIPKDWNKASIQRKKRVFSGIRQPAWRIQTGESIFFSR